jgi:hypothetical protein
MYNKPLIPTYGYHGIALATTNVVAVIRGNTFMFPIKACAIVLVHRLGLDRIGGQLAWTIHMIAA